MKLPIPNRMFFLGVIGLMLGTFASDASTNILWMATGHTREVNAVAFSPDGSLVASASDDFSVKLWRMPDGALLRTLKGHGEDVQSANFFPDGRQLLTGGKDFTLRIWDVNDGRQLRSFPEEDSANAKQVSTPRHCVALSPDGQWIASGFGAYLSTLEYTNATLIHIRNATNGLLQRTFYLTNGSGLNALVISPDGQHLAAGGNFIYVWRLSDGLLEWSNLVHTIDSLCFSPDSQILAGGNDKRHKANENIFLWQTATGTELREWEAHYDAIRSLAFSPDGQQLVSASSDSSLRMWRVNTGDLLANVTRNSEGFRTVAYSPDGQYVCAGTKDDQVLLYRALDAGLIRPFTGHSEPVHEVYFAPDQSVVMTWSGQGDDHTLRAWHTVDGSLAWDHNVQYVDFGHQFAQSTDGKLLAVLQVDNALSPLRGIALRDITDGRVVRTLTNAVDHFASIFTFSADGQSILSVDSDPMLRQWRISDGKTIREINWFGGRPNRLFISPDQRYLAANFADGTFRLWLFGESLWRGAWNGQFLGFSPDGLMFASKEHSGDIRWWRCSDNTLVRTFAERGEIREFLNISPDWDYLLAVGYSGLQCWRIADESLIREFSEETLVTRAVQVSPNREFLAFGRQDATVVYARNSLLPPWDSNSTPKIAVQPRPVTVAAGDEAVFWVNATGAKPVSYQWYYNQALIPGATNQTLLKTGVKPAEAGAYAVWLTNAFGAVLSESAALTVTLPPQILVNPRGQSVARGTTVNLSVSAKGSEWLTYQWRFNSIPLAGATNSEYSLVSAQPIQSGLYDVVISQALGSCTSAPAYLQVYIPASLAWTRYTDANHVNTVAFSPAEDYLACGGYYYYSLNDIYYSYAWWDLNRVADGILAVPRHLQTESSTGWITSIGFNSPGDKVITSSWTGSGVEFWENQQGEFVLSKIIPNCWSAIFSSNGEFMGGMRGSLDFNSQNNWAVYNLLEDGFNAVSTNVVGGYISALSPDGTLFLTLANQEIQLREVASGQLLKTFTDYFQRMVITRLVFSPEGTRVAAGDRDGVVWIWRVADGVLEHRLFNRNRSEIGVLAYTPDGHFLVTGVVDGGLEVWRLPEAVSMTLKVPSHTLEFASQVAFSNQGRWLAIVSPLGLWVMPNPLQGSAAQRPQFRNFRWLAPNRWEVSVEGAAGEMWKLQSSSDLKQWSDDQAVVLTNAVTSLSVEVAPNKPQLFYRLQQSP